MYFVIKRRPHVKAGSIGNPTLKTGGRTPFEVWRIFICSRQLRIINYQNNFRSNCIYSDRWVLNDWKDCWIGQVDWISGNRLRGQKLEIWHSLAVCKNPCRCHLFPVSQGLLKIQFGFSQRISPIILAYFLMHIGIHVQRPSSLKDTESVVFGPWTIATADLSDRANR